MGACTYARPGRHRGRRDLWPFSGPATLEAVLGARETVRNYIRSLLKALGARSRLEATLIALRDGLVDLVAD
jgi:hypothetical protein